MVATWKQVITTAPPEKKDPSEEIEKGNAFSNQILILFSEPLLPETATESLAIQREIEAIVEALEEVSYPISVEIIVKVATAENIQNIFHQRVRPLIIHFIGHGTIDEGNTALVLEDEVGIARHFDERELAIALADGNRIPCQLAVINSCHSGKLAEAIAEAKVPHVIAVDAQETILNEAARCFAKSLYKNLFEQNSVQNSFSIGRNAIILDRELQEKFNLKTHQKGVNIDEAYKFQLLPENQHHSAELDFESARTREINYPNLFDTNLPSQDPKFIGRKQDIHSVVHVFTRSDNRCVVLHGMGGIGKTTLAKAIGRWFQQRERFKDGVWRVNAEDIDSIRNLIIKIQQELELENPYLVQKLREKKILLILDDLDLLVSKDNELKELIELINYLIENCPYLKILITTRKTLVSNIELCYQQEVHSMVNWTETLFSKYIPLNLNNQWEKEPNYSENKQRLRLFFDGYPLAIKLAAAYVKDKVNISLAKLCEDLDIKPLKVLEIESPEERKDNSLRVSLEISFNCLSVPARDLFPFLTYFPGGLSYNLAHHIWSNKNTRSTLDELFRYSMVEQYSAFASDWRVNIPEPVRSYAESKLPPGQSLERIAPIVLSYYDARFVKEAEINLEILKAERSNLIKFLEWGYKNEDNYQECLCARITVSLVEQWQLIESETNLLSRLNSALEAAQRNDDSVGEQLVTDAITQVTARPAAKDILSMAKEKDDLESFSFEVVTVNERGEEVKREQKETLRLVEELDDEIALEMVEIPGGSFMMGSPEEEGYEFEKPQHQVTIEPFFMGKFQVTQAQWQAVMRNNPARFQNSSLNPVEQVSWEDVKEFCARLSQKTGKEYRLPTEAEWEYACRGGTESPFYFGETISTELANYNGNYTYGEGVKGEYRKQTTPVGYFKVANNFGLYDMHGNVWEWCEDDWHENYEGAPTDGSAWLLGLGSTKVIRGGSWNYYPFFCRSASRFDLRRVYRYSHIGVRVVCVAPRTT